MFKSKVMLPNSAKSYPTFHSANGGVPRARVTRQQLWAACPHPDDMVKVWENLTVNPTCRQCGGPLAYAGEQHVRLYEQRFGEKPPERG